MTVENSVREKQALKDNRYISAQKHHGPNGAFTGFDTSVLPKGPIDYIFVTENVRVLSQGNLSDIVEGRYPLDRLPVLAEIELP